jgi:hypothetical protein
LDGASQFPDDEDRRGPLNGGLLAIQPCDTAVSPENILLHEQNYEHY